MFVTLSPLPLNFIGVDDEQCAKEKGFGDENQRESAMIRCLFRTAKIWNHVT